MICMTASKMLYVSCTWLFIIIIYTHACAHTVSWKLQLSYASTIDLCAYLFPKLESWPKTVQAKFTFAIYPITFPKENANEWKKLFKPCASQRLFLPVSMKIKFSQTYEQAASCTYNIYFLCFPADPEGGGFVALCGHRHPFSAASRRRVVTSFSVQYNPLSCHGSRARGAKDRLVQPFCPSPLLRQNWHQLRCHAHEHDTTQGEII